MARSLINAYLRVDGANVTLDPAWERLSTPRLAALARQLELRAAGLARLAADANAALQQRPDY